MGAAKRGYPGFFPPAEGAWNGGRLRICVRKLNSRCADWCGTPSGDSAGYGRCSATCAASEGSARKPVGRHLSSRFVGAAIGDPQGGRVFAKRTFEAFATNVAPHSGAYPGASALKLPWFGQYGQTCHCPQRPHRSVRIPVPSRHSWKKILPRNRSVRLPPLHESGYRLTSRPSNYRHIHSYRRQVLDGVGAKATARSSRLALQPLTRIRARANTRPCAFYCGSCL